MHVEPTQNQPLKFKKFRYFQNAIDKLEANYRKMFVYSVEYFNKHFVGPIANIKFVSFQFILRKYIRIVSFCAITNHYVHSPFFPFLYNLCIVLNQKVRVGHCITRVIFYEPGKLIPVACALDSVFVFEGIRSFVRCTSYFFMKILH